MANPLPNDIHTTDGETYRSPAHPQMVAALGRAQWNFFSLEETVVAILYEAGEFSLVSGRSLTAGDKAKCLRKLIARLEGEGAPQDVADALKKAETAFDHARASYRNALSHAHPFTAGYAQDGTYLPGLAHTTKHLQTVLAREAADLHEIAHRIEDAISPLGDAREALKRLPQKP